MKPTELSDYLSFAIANNFPTLITGKPGIGKSDIVSQAAKVADTKLIISHPVVSDPTDYKGLPFPNLGIIVLRNIRLNKRRGYKKSHN